MNKSAEQNAQPNDAVTPVALTNSDKAFGLVFCVVFSLVALYPLTTGAPIRTWASGVSALFLVVALARPQFLSPLNRMWLKLGLLLHRIVSPVALFVVFCVAVLPTGLVMRMLGKDLLRLRIEPESESYWIERTPPGRADQQMRKQF